MTQNYFPRDEYERRWQRVEEQVRAHGFECAVIWGRSGGTFDRCADVLYLANFFSTASGQELDGKLKTASAHAAVVVQPGREPELICDEQPNPGTVPMEHVTATYDPVRAVAKSMRERGILGRVALVGTDFFAVKYSRLLENAAPGIDWVPFDDLVRDVRRIKSPRELDALREGGEIVTHGLNATIEGLVSGRMTEAEAAAAGAKEVISRGGVIHKIPLNHGDTIDWFTRVPLMGYSLDAPEPGDMVRGWIYGPIWQGYWLDPGRTAVCGAEPTADQKRLIEACAGIVDRLVAETKPGTTAMTLARTGEQMTADFGGGGNQMTEKWPIYGHGIGLFFERPSISTKTVDIDIDIEAGMALGFEAFLHLDGVGSAGFEQNVIVTDEGAELLTTTPMIWH